SETDCAAQAPRAAGSQIAGVPMVGILPMMFNITGFLWSIAISDIALGLDGFVLLVALVIGFAPLLKYLPVIGPYVPVAKVAAVVISLSICFLLGFRVADERFTSNNLRAIIATQQADLENAN